jgi:lysophospholipase L1-like esterase
VTFISLGHNDKNVGAGVDVATFKASTQTLIDNFKQAGSSNVILVCQNPNQSGNFADYNQAKYELADSNNIPLIDIYHRWGESYATASATGFTADGAHPSPIGYGDEVAAFLSVIS